MYKFTGIDELRYLSFRVHQMSGPWWTPMIPGNSSTLWTLDSAIIFLLPTWSHHTNDQCTGLWLVCLGNIADGRYDLQCKAATSGSRSERFGFDAESLSDLAAATVIRQSEVGAAAWHDRCE
uniref:Uncharacterized protein n=1 Tax=Setaria viridis TaxID=4556 RepID=A0A4U6TX44_SETVI|nr:hypothetical protein SEVIR_7G174400v2 [Setaria viridis]